MRETAEDRLKALGFAVPDLVQPLANYMPGHVSGDYLFLSGQISRGGWCRELTSWRGRGNRRHYESTKLMLDRDTFIRPIAHRGLHNANKGIVENTLPAFAAAIAKNYGIECDLRPAAGGLPVVFHDETLERLTASKGRVADLDAAALKRVKHKIGGESISTFAEMLDAVDGAVPLLVEIKSEWDAPDKKFLNQIAKLSSSYRGPVALMSFDPEVMTIVREFAPKVPRGIVSGAYAGAGWWNRKISKARAANLRDLLESGPIDPHFYAYQVSALPTPVTRFVREVLELPLFTWTVRTANERTLAQNWADAEIFEGSEP